MREPFETRVLKFSPRHSGRPRNSIVQAAKRRARGYRSKTKMITIIYLIAGKLLQLQIHTI
jgi:hypothetical protein